MEPHLDFDRETLVAFDDGTYRWLSVKRFKIAGQGAPIDYRTAMIRHQEYSTDYPDPSGSSPRHGPYDARAITPECFHEVGVERLPRMLDCLYQLHDLPPRQSVLDRIAAAVAPITKGRCFLLRNLSESIILGGAFLDFQEVVCIDDESRFAYLLVLAADV